MHSADIKNTTYKENLNILSIISPDQGSKGLPSLTYSYFFYQIAWKVFHKDKKILIQYEQKFYTNLIAKLRQNWLSSLGYNEWLRILLDLLTQAWPGCGFM